MAELAENAKDGLPHFNSGRYQDFKRIGAGGMGSVFKAHDAVLNKAVAMKLLSQQTWTDDQAVRFQREAQALAKLNHPNIAQIYDFGFDDKQTPYMVLELLDGVDLTQYMDDNIVSKRDIIKIAEQVCAGLSHAHEKGIVHRDIKPGNILVEREGLGVKIVDFGIAKFVGEEEQSKTLTAYGAIIGSPLFMSPEQVKREKISEQSDIYSLGCVLFLMLTGQPPFYGETAIETATMHVETPAPTLSSITDETYAKQWEELVAKCLSKNPSKRFASVNELRAALLLCEESSSTAESNQKGSEFNKPSKAPWMTIGALFVVALILAIGGFRLLDIALEPKEDTLGPRKTEIDPAFDVEASLNYKPLKGGQLAAVLKEYNEDNWKKLANLENVREISIFDSKIPTKFFRECKSKSTLFKIRINNIDDMNPEAFTHLHGYAVLNEIDFDGCNMSRTVFEKLSFAQQFRELDAKHSTIEDPSAFNLLPWIRVINLDGSSITDDTLAAMTKLQALQALSLSENKTFTGRGLASISARKTLTSLNMHACSGLKPQELMCLKHFEKLNSIELNNNAITREMVNTLSRIPKLDSLMFKQCEIEDDAYDELVNFPALRSLNFDSSPTNDKNIEFLFKLNKLNSVDLTDTMVSEKAIAKLQKHFPRLTIIARPRNPDKLKPRLAW